MKILSLNFGQEETLGILKGFSHQFKGDDKKQFEPLCLIGDNGAGKSKLLECLAEIFHLLDNNHRKVKSRKKPKTSPFSFSIEYSTQLQGIDLRILIKSASNKAPELFEIIDGDRHIKVTSSKDVLMRIPQYIVGYTSGGNETLSSPFAEDNATYADEVTRRALDPSLDESAMEDSRLVMMSRDMNYGAIISNLMLNEEVHLDIFREQLRIDSLNSFRIKVQFNHTAAKRIKGVKRTQQLDRYIENLKRSSTCWNYEQDDEAWIFDFLVTEETKKAFAQYFLSPYSLFRAIQKLEMLNELMIPAKVRTHYKNSRSNYTVPIRPPVPAEEDRVFKFDRVQFNLTHIDQPVDYVRLSDGEHQYLHVFSSLMIFDHESILFLFDEPESHFNPRWRLHFISTLNDVIKKKNHCVLLTTHAPFVPSDLSKESVFVFKRNNEGKVEIENPRNETYGASFSNILADVFGLNPPPVSRKSLKSLEELQKCNDPEEIEKRLADFGDSMEKFALYERIEILKEERL